jgi:hypothetical protein
MLYFLFYGRREFIIGLLLIGLIYSLKKNINLFSIKKIPLIILSLFIVTIASNFYQNIRFQIASYAITNTFVLKKSIFEYAFDFESSSKNIEDRVSIYSYTSILIQKMLIEDFKPLYGEILAQGFINIIPSIIYPEKKVINDDELVNYALKLSNKDMPNSIAGSLFVDFGALAYLVYPLIMSVYIIIITLMIYKCRRNSLLFMLLISIMIYSLFNVEAVITNMFATLRDMLILIIFIQTIYYLKYFRKN